MTGLALLRLPALAALGVAAAFGLFVVMSQLISSELVGRLALPDPVRFDFVRLPERRLASAPDSQPLPSKPKSKPPPAPDLDTDTDTASPDALRFSADTGYELDLLDISGLAGSLQAGDPVPILRVSPLYPARAASRNIEGWVELAFTIAATGTTKDVRVVRAEPENIFDRAAVKAVRKWKYKPQVVDGKPADRPNVHVVIKFELDE